MPLQPEIASYLESIATVIAPALWDAPVEVHRRARMNRPQLAGTPAQIYEVEHKFIAGPTADLPIRIYRPDWHAPMPALVFFHGGGWVLNTLDIYEQELRSFANKGQFIVVAVGYQKSPEHAFPIPFDDCYATLQWVYDNAAGLGIDPTMIGVGGDSAGGNLAAAVALKARDTKRIPLAFQLLLYPCNDYAMAFSSADRNATGFGLKTTEMRWFWDQYLPNLADRENPYAVPVKAAHFAGFNGLPPTIIVTAEYDCLLDDGKNYAKLLTDAGVSVIYREFEGMIHGFMTMAAITPEAEAAQEIVAAEINALLSRTL